MKKLLLIPLLFLSSLAFSQSVQRNFPAKETDNVFTGKNQFTQGARLGPKTFAQLPADALDGTIIECSDCQAVDPCVGSGSGAYAHKINGAWSCTVGGSSNLRDGLIVSSLGTAAPTPLATKYGPCTTNAPYKFGRNSDSTYESLSTTVVTSDAAFRTSPYFLDVNCAGIHFDDLPTSLETGSAGVTGASAAFVSIAHLIGNRGVNGGQNAALSIFNWMDPATTQAFNGVNNNLLYAEQIFDGAPTSVSSVSLATIRARANSHWSAGAPSNTVSLESFQFVVENDSSEAGSHTGANYVHPFLAGIDGSVTNHVSGIATAVYGANPTITCGSNNADCSLFTGTIVGSSSGVKAYLLQPDTSGASFGIYQKGANDPNLFGKVGIGESPVADFDVGGKWLQSKSGYVDIVAITDPGNPTSNRCRLFADPSGNLIGHKSDGTSCLAGGGAGTPGGSDTQVQFNSSSAFAGSANLTFVSPTLKIGVAGSTTGQLQQTGATSGTVTVTPQAVAGTVTLTYPNQSGTFAVSANVPLVLSATSGALTCPTCTVNTSALSQFTVQTTSTQFAGIISDETGSGGSGVLVFSNSPTITTPTIASFVNATHNHTNAAGGGQLTDSAFSTAIGIAKGGTNNTTAPDDSFLLGNGTTYILTVIPNCVDSAGQHLNYDASTNAILCGTSGGAGGGANQALSNLASVAFNVNLVPNTNNGLDLGSSGAALRTGYFATSVLSPFFSTNAAAPASVGLLRGVNNSALVAARNAANSGDCTFGLNSSDQFYTDCPFTSSGTSTYIEIGSETVATTGSANTARITYNDTTGKLRVSLDAASPVTVATSAEKLSLFAATSSAELAGVISDEQGSGALVFATSPTLTTPVLGVATATSINKVTITAPASSATLTIADGKTLTISNTMSLAAGADGQTYTFPATSATIFGSTTTQDVRVAGSYCADAGANDTYACNLSPAITAYVTGTHYFFKANTANTGAASIAFNGLSNITIVKYQGGAAQTLSDNDIRAGADVEVMYDGTNMQILSVLGNAAGAGTGDVTDVGDCTSAACFTAAGTGTNLVFKNATSGTVTLQTVAGALGTVTVSLPAATDTLVGKATTDTFTNKTYDSAGTGNVLKISGTTVSGLTGSGGSLVMATSPVLVTPTLGVASATSINKVAITAPASSATLTIADGKTLTVNNILTFAGTDSTTITFQGTDTYVGRATTDTLTNKTYDVEGTGNSFTDSIKFWIPAASCQNTTAFLLWDTPTTNPAVAACDTGTNIQKGTADFADGANSLSMQTHFMLPSDWSGTVDIRGKWFSSVTSGNVVWQVATACVADAETSDPSFNTASTATDATKGTTLQDNDFTITSVTTTGCAAGELMYLKIFRDPANASDTMAGTARLRGIEVTERRTK